MEEKTKITIVPDGPIIVEGEIKLIGTDDAGEGKTKCFFCRCGGSSKKPYCDGTHKKIEFKG